MFDQGEFNKAKYLIIILCEFYNFQLKKKFTEKTCAVKRKQRGTCWICLRYGFTVSIVIGQFPFKFFVCLA